MHQVMTTTTKVHEVTISLRQLALNLTACPPEYQAGATVFVRVPGGGDWSSADLDVDEVVVSWSETSVETTEK